MGAAVPANVHETGKTAPEHYGGLMEQRKNFDLVADSWDEEPRRLQLSRDIAAAILARIPISDNWQALDFGCGTGLVTLQLAPHLKQITGIDSSQGMIDRFIAKITELAADNVTPLHRDLELGEFSGANYDLVVSAMVFHHIPDPSDILNFLRRIINPGGWLAIADLEAEDGSFHDDGTGVFHHGFSPDTFRDLLNRCGFTDVAIDTVTGITKGVRDYPVFLATARVF